MLGYDEIHGRGSTMKPHGPRPASDAHINNRPETGSPRVGVLLVGHGTRDHEGVDEFWITCRAVAAAGETLVEGAFLEFAAPSIEDGFAALARRGAERVVVMPLLLFAAGHAQHDIPAAVAAAAGKHPGLIVSQAPHLGCHPSLLALSRQRFAESLAGAADATAQQTALVLVGRGSHDAGASAEMHAFARLRAEQRDVASVHVAFLSMAAPSLGDVLEQVARLETRRVVVQPHLLFGGLLAQRVSASLANIAARYPDVQWLVTRHLGPSELMVRAVLDRVSAITHRSIAPPAAIR
jgi:sirohydrochlorin cobaltochelatase